MASDDEVQTSHQASATLPPPRRDEGSVSVLYDADSVRRYLQGFEAGLAGLAARPPQISIPSLLAQRPGDHELSRLCRLAERFGVPVYVGEQLEVDAAVVALIPAPVARRLNAVPVAASTSFLVVAVSDIGRPEVMATLEFIGSRRVVLLLAGAPLVRQALSSKYDRLEDETMIRRLGLHGSNRDEQLPQREVERLSSEQPVVKLVADLIDQAVRLRASDIHLRPGEDDFEVLFRIDGELVSARRYLKPLQAAVVSRFKVIGGMNLAEHRVPQDGRATVVAEEEAVDLRLSLLPTVNGESLAVRLLNTRYGLRDLAEIGFDARDERLFRDLLQRNHGMILVTGPTGCGKSTTLYSALIECRKQNINIVTVEDPVEYHIADVQQVQVNRAAGLTFPRTLRNLVRHDPDTIMIGEIRDSETAEIAVESALTGHLVLSTLHTNSAATAVTRLLNLEVAPYLLRSTLLGVLAQRLARRNCPHCLVEEHPDAHLRDLLGVAAGESFLIGEGCAQCNGSGVRGRLAVYELLEIDASTAELIVPDADASAIHAHAVRRGMRTVTEHALALARAGTISLREALQVRVE